MDLGQYIAVFLEEGREHLQSLNHSMLDFESNPANVAIIDNIFRSAHTIKGMSATMGFTKIAELTHEMENLLDLLRNSKMQADRKIIDTLFKCVDFLEQLLEGITPEGLMTTDVSIVSLVTTLQQLCANENNAAADKLLEEPITGFNSQELDSIQKSVSKNSTVYKIIVDLDEDTLLKSARAFMVLRAIEDVGDIIHCTPAAETFSGDFNDLQFSLIVTSEVEPAKIEDSILNVLEIKAVQTIPYIDDEVAGERKKGKLGLNQVALEETNASRTVEDKVISVEKGSRDKKKQNPSVRVDIDKLDSLLNLVGELVINKTRLAQIGTVHHVPELNETIEAMDRTTNDLQAVVMKVRMVPIGQVFNRFPRMVRDLAHELQKEIDFIIKGEDTELDRTVIDEIGDPIVHLLRNAIDHGVEKPVDRQVQGKTSTAILQISARHEGNNVVIEVADDGKGIDPEVIKTKAIEKGLIQKTEAEKITDVEAVHLIFSPGFSTVDTVTDISGRGVGMDAVRTKIESLGGKIDVESKVGEGSKFKIQIPLTLAIITALMVNAGGEVYAIPLGATESAITLEKSQISTVQGREMFVHRGNIIPIVRLKKILKVMCKEDGDNQEINIVIVRCGERMAGLVVDSLIGQQEIVIKSISKLLASCKVCAGATILGDGQVALILNVDALFNG